MLIFISDLHFSDGTFDFKDLDNPKNNISHNISHEAFKLFWDDIYRVLNSNKENKVKEITLILLGDIFEMRSTTQWVESDYDASGKRKLKNRPWNELKDKPSETCKKVLEDIIKTNEEAFKYLNPTAVNQVDSDNGIYKLIKDEKIEIKVEYIVGNHDRVINFHEDHSLRQYIAKRLGWILPHGTDSDTRRFKFLFSEDNIGISTKHGHCYDSIDFYKDYLLPPIGSVLSDTLGRIMCHIQETGDKELIEFCMDLDNVRPSSDRFIWVMSNLPKDEVAKNKLRGVLLKSIQELKEDSEELFDFLYPRVKEYIKPNFFQKLFLGILSLFTDKEKFIKKKAKKIIFKLIDEVEEKLKKQEKEEPLKSILNSILDRIKSLGKPKRRKDGKDKDFSYFEKAYEEITDSGIDSKLKYIVYGHTHRYKLVPLRTVKRKDQEKETFYFNSGTWKRTIQRNVFNNKEIDFQKWIRLSFINFFNTEIQENKDHTFDLWHGNLQKKQTSIHY